MLLLLIKQVKHNSIDTFFSTKTNFGKVKITRLSKAEY